MTLTPAMATVARKTIATKSARLSACLDQRTSQAVARTL